MRLWNRINDPFFNVFRRFNTLKGKPSLLRKISMILHKKSLILIIFYWFQCFDKKQENKPYIHYLSLKLYKISIFNLFGCLNTFCRKQLVHVTIYFFYVKFHKLRFFSHFLRVLTAFYIIPPFTSICDLNHQFFNFFYCFTIFLCQIHLTLLNKSMFLHPKVSFSVIFFEFPCFN